MVVEGGEKMAEMMKAFVFEKANVAKYKDVPKPQIKADEVLVKVKANGICHSDYELMEGQYIVPFTYPCVPGHEWSGEVVEVGDDVTTFKPGDRVVGECVIGCGSCKVCQEGNFTYCPTADHFGFTFGLNGAVADYLRAKPGWLHKLPDNVNWKEGSMIEPFSVAYYGIDGIGGCDASDTVVVLGGGTIGLCSLAVAKGMNARVILIEPLEYRRRIALQMHADIVIDPTAEDAPKKVRELTGGYGADLVVEASGSSSALTSTFDYVKNGGRCSFVGINIGKEQGIELGKIQQRGITCKGMVGSPYVWEKCITFLAQSGVDISPISTHQFKLDEVEKAYEFARKIVENELVKVTVMME